MTGSKLQFLSGVIYWLDDECAIEFYANGASGLISFRIGSHALARLSEYDLAYLDAVQAFCAFHAFEPLLQDVARAAFDAAPGTSVDISESLVRHRRRAGDTSLALAA